MDKLEGINRATGMRIETLRKILAWEESYKTNPDPESIITLFQNLIDEGDILHMDEYYKQTANTMIEHGLCHRPQLKVVK